MSTTPQSPVASVMSWPVATIDHEATLEEAAEALAADDLGALLVLREGDPAGIISERDLIAHIAAGADLSHLHVGEVMAGDMVTVQTETTVVAAARAMVDADIRHLPVVKDHTVAGMVSIRDLVPVLVDGIARGGLPVRPDVPVAVGNG